MNERQKKALRDLGDVLTINQMQVLQSALYRFVAYSMDQNVRATNQGNKELANMWRNVALLAKDMNLCNPDPEMYL